MKKLVLLFLGLASCILLSGCLGKVEVEPKQPDNTEVNSTQNSPTQVNESEEALLAIKDALKNDEWVKNHVMLRKTTFGEDASGDQELKFRKLGKDRVIVNAFAYDQIFGTANTIIYYKDGEVKTFSQPSLDSPDHPGHIGYAVDPVNEVLVSYYMHMGYYGTYFSKILDDKVEFIASFEGTEWDDDGNLVEDENGTPMIKYTFKIAGKEENGVTTFEEYEKEVEDYSKQYTIETIDIPLTVENIEKI